MTPVSGSTPDPPQWTGDNVTDPDDGAVWLAIDTYPTVDLARAKMADDGHEFVKDIGRFWFRLRHGDWSEDDDRWAMEEWGSEIIAEHCEPGEGREFWGFATSKFSGYLEADHA